MAENEKPAAETPRPADAGARAAGGPQAPAEGQSQGGSVSVVPALLVMASRSESVTRADRDLGRDLQAHLALGADAATHQDSGFRRNTAYYVQDVEKALGERLPLSKELRAEVTSLATNLPGLTNDRAQALLQSTEQIGDRKLVQSIRQFAGEIAAEPKLNPATIASAIENFENKVRLAARAEPIADAPKPETAPAGPGAAATAAQARAEAPTAPTNGGSPANGNGHVQNNAQPSQGWIGQRTIADTLMDSIRAIGRPPPSPSQGLDLPHTPMVDRIAAFEARILVEKEDKMLARAEKTGQAAIEAIQGINNTSAGAVLSRINEAARNNPGGMEAVLSEMRPGGQFADLRTQFNAALNTDHAAAAAYDKAAATLARYGEQRPALEGILAKRADPALSAKLERIDAELGEGAGRVPSKQDGKSMLDDLAKTVAEIVSKAVDSVRAVFSRSASPGASAGPGPSPSP